MRRRLIRGLQYLITGHDTDKQRSSIIIDLQMKKAAENFEIPNSSSFIYDILVMLLLEQEGRLDGLRTRRCFAAIEENHLCFSDSDDVEMARLAVVQKSPLDMFCVAVTLYGKKDATDQLVAQILRQGIIQSLK